MSVTLFLQIVLDALRGMIDPLGWIIIGFTLACAACLLAGFMTPLVAAIIVLGTSILAVTGVLPSAVEVMILAIIIVLLGPGAFSLDARMFGRREILVSNTSRSSKS